jgi:hypothetical protein
MDPSIREPIMMIPQSLGLTRPPSRILKHGGTPRMSFPSRDKLRDAAHAMSRAAPYRATS